MHSGIQKTYNQLKNRIYCPKLIELVHWLLTNVTSAKKLNTYETYKEQVQETRNPIR